METNERPEEGDESKLRRWVANLQLESWQLELLITGFSIFLLAESVQGYRDWSNSLIFHKLVPTGNANAIFVVSIRFIVDTIPYALQFFLISLLVHLLLRGFWIGIVGLSSVSNNIGLDSLNLKGPFRKYLPGKVRTLDELILHLDKISSVIFSYTYLLAFSILSVVFVSAFLFMFVGVGTMAPAVLDNQGVAAIISVVSLLIGFILAIAAIIFFLDTLLFSAFKKSRWFSSLYYPIYKFYSIISLSFLYRSIYYHLITNYKKKQIIVVTLLLTVIVFFSFRIERWNTYSFYPMEDNSNGLFFQPSQYDDERGGRYVRSASIPSKMVKGNFLPLFIRYSPKDNIALELLCPDLQRLENDASFIDAFNAGVESAMDTTLNVNEMLYDSDYEGKVNEVLSCFGELYELKINGEVQSFENLFFTRHQSNYEKGVMTMLDISSLNQGLNVIELKKADLNVNPFGKEITAANLEFEPFVKIPFWKEE